MFIDLNCFLRWAMWPMGLLLLFWNTYLNSFRCCRYGVLQFLLTTKLSYLVGKTLQSGCGEWRTEVRSAHSPPPSTYFTSRWVMTKEPLLLWETNLVPESWLCCKSYAQKFAEPSHPKILNPIHKAESRMTFLFAFYLI